MTHPHESRMETLMTAIIGIDLHKASHTAVAIDQDERHSLSCASPLRPVRRSGCWRGRRRSITGS